MSLIIPKGYKPKLDLYDTQRAIALIKRVFQQELAEVLNLERVSAPLFVDPATGLNDNLNGCERPVKFSIPATGTDAEVVHSLAKWKRMALFRYGFKAGEGLYTDMDAIRRDEALDNLHSIYVDQWDWEKIITNEQRTAQYLYETARSIVLCLCSTLSAVKERYPNINIELDPELSIISSQELEDLYPSRTPEMREYLYVKEHNTAFVSRIGEALRSGKPHGGRAPDYDDWRLNGDILFYYPVLDCAMEVSSMGIRVDPETLDRQLKIAGCEERRELTYHKMLLGGELPLTIGGGIGQSRICMLLLEKAHIGEVQSSVWSFEDAAVCSKAGITLL
ncbi:MAG: Aspartate--ammonia ligase [Firmicutes bacterium ADurb.Bin182]|nr:MAG: Aspartate--ammonia ligase [Firmicutes bacterium ADurb.Bin182]